MPRTTYVDKDEFWEFSLPPLTVNVAGKEVHIYVWERYGDESTKTSIGHTTGDVAGTELSIECYVDLDPGVYYWIAATPGGEKVYPEVGAEELDVS